MAVTVVSEFDAMRPWLDGQKGDCNSYCIVPKAVSHSRRSGLSYYVARYGYGTDVDHEPSFQ